MIVLKVGGASVGRIDVGDEPTVVVHGAGPQISAEMERRGIPVRFVGGRRFTGEDTLEVVRETFAAVNAELCNLRPYRNFKLARMPFAVSDASKGQITYSATGGCTRPRRLMEP